MTSGGAHAAGPKPDLLARLWPAIPLLVLYFALSTLYAWQASRRLVPTIFIDELELTQLARAIAETGEPARRGEPYGGLASLVAYALAPVWWIDSTTTAYATAKLVLVLAMTATIFPAFALARLVVPYWYAVGAAGASIAVPALAYSPILVEEPLAYPLSTLALWTIARCLVEPSWTRLGVAVLASGLAALTRTQLSILLAVLALGLLWIGWQSGPVRRWRATWSRWDWVGAATLAIGVALAFSAAMGSLSRSWRETTGFFKERIVEHGSWALGALAVGIGIVPVLVGLAALARPRAEPHDPRTRAFVTTTVASLATFVTYAGIKGAHLSTVFATLIVERNVIYLVPVLAAATALAVARGIGGWWSIGAAAAVAGYVVLTVPIQLEHPYYEAHGLAILAFANRELGWPEGRIETAIAVAFLVALTTAVALRVLPRGSAAFRTVAASAAALVVVWSLTTQVYAAEGERTLSDQAARNFPKPYQWVDEATHGAPVVVLGQQITDPTNIWLTEFFNRSIRKVWSLDGTAIRAGAPVLTPDLATSDGTLTPAPGTRYALALKGVELDAPIVARHGGQLLHRIDGKPLRLKAALTGVQSDGWMAAPSDSEERVARAAYTRYDVSRDGPGFALVKLSRVEWCPSPEKRTPARAVVRIGPVVVGPDKQPAIGRVTAEQTATVRDCVITPFLLPVPERPWRIEIELEPTFVPKEVDPRQSDARKLGAVVDAGFRPLFGD
ncbi:MAG: hypothetical protein KatS3mg012_0332 [Gaiellaceae bacterium]|nr:MAG: hypothetical protein KatS3mg012_0332 [Gaiellaceae bacterium]